MCTAQLLYIYSHGTAVDVVIVSFRVVLSRAVIALWTSKSTKAICTDIQIVYILDSRAKLV